MSIIRCWFCDEFWAVFILIPLLCVYCLVCYVCHSIQNLTQLLYFSAQLPLRCIIAHSSNSFHFIHSLFLHDYNQFDDAAAECWWVSIGFCVLYSYKWVHPDQISIGISRCGQIYEKMNENGKNLKKHTSLWLLDCKQHIEKRDYLSVWCSFRSDFWMNYAVCCCCCWSIIHFIEPSVCGWMARQGNEGDFVFHSNEI